MSRMTDDEKAAAVIDAFSTTFRYGPFERINQNVSYQGIKGVHRGYNFSHLFCSYNEWKPPPRGTILRHLDGGNRDAGTLWMGDGCKKKCTCKTLDMCSSTLPFRLYGCCAYKPDDPASDESVKEAATAALWLLLNRWNVEPRLPR